MTVHCFTSASFAYLDRVRVLGQSLRRQHPDWVFTLCLSDVEPPGFTFDIANEPIDRVVRIGEMGFPDLQGWIFEHNVVELCTAVKGQMLCRLLDEGAEKIIYLDPDIAVFASLDEVVHGLDTFDILLTPHLLGVQPSRPAIESHEIGSLKHGVYNLGFAAVANRASGRAFAEWWRDRLIDYCFEDIPNGLFTDQRWCDLVPALFDKVGILRDSGYNVASWNILTRPIRIHNDGSITAGGAILRFFHFTKVTSVGETELVNNSSGNIEVLELMKWYRRSLAEARVEGLPERWWAFNQYNDGSRIAAAHRLVYRKYPAIRQSIADPFASTASEFDKFC